MKQTTGYYNTFVVKIWQDGTRGTIRGHIQHASSQEYTYFLSLENMEDFIVSHLSPPPGYSYPLGKRREAITTVEDSEEIVGFYRRYLERHGYQVVNLTEGERVPLWVRELSPFAVLLDVNLPDIDGWQVLENLKTSRETAHVPVIICSIVDEEAKGLSLGAAAYLTKPILEDELLQAMAMVAELQTI